MQCFSRLTVILGFELNQEYIATHLCVNRDSPAMECNGHCFLHKKLDQNQDRQNQENEDSGNRLVINLFCPDQPYSLPSPQESNTHKFVGGNNHYHYMPVFGFFHPPELAV